MGVCKRDMFDASVPRIAGNMIELMREHVIGVPATATQKTIAESLWLNPQDRIFDCVDEQIVPAPLIQQENIEINLEENDQVVQSILLRKASSSRYRVLLGRQ